MIQDLLMPKAVCQCCPTLPGSVPSSAPSNPWAGKGRGAQKSIKRERREKLKPTTILSSTLLLHSPSSFSNPGSGRAETGIPLPHCCLSNHPESASWMGPLLTTPLFQRVTEGNNNCVAPPHVVVLWKQNAQHYFFFSILKNETDS